MPKDLWTQVDDYINTTIVRPDTNLDAAMNAALAAGLPPISVTAAQGKLLMLLARMIGARSILEIGTLGGYSTIWLARGLADGGRLVTLELEQRHADVARHNIDRAGVGAQVEILVGRAADSLPRLTSHPAAPFDVTFIDADKASIPEYYDWSVRLSRAGGVIVVDNVVRDGELIDADSSNPDVVGVRRLHELLAQDRRVDATTMQTVGGKGYDGFTLIVTNPQ